MSHPSGEQPAATQPMTTQPPKESFIQTEARAYVDGAGKEVAKEAGEKTVEMASDPQQTLDNAKAEAQGLWAKYCGCLSSLSG